MMYKVGIVVLATLFTGNVNAQASDCVRIGKHQLGETISQWVRESPGYLENLERRFNCSNRKRNKQICAKVASIRSGTAEEIGSAEGKRWYSWRFRKGRLLQVQVEPNHFATNRLDRTLNFDEEVAFLAQRYGEPSKIEKTPCHNAYGAQWESRTALWRFADGSLVAAVGGIEFADINNVSYIVFQSKEWLDTHGKKEHPTNPY